MSASLRIMQFSLACGLVQALLFTELLTTIYNHDYVEQLNITLVPYNGHNAINGTTSFRRPLTNARAYFTLDMERGSSGMSRVLKTTLDVCKLLDEANSRSKLAKSVFKELLKSPTYRIKCPIPAHTAFKLEYFDVEMPEMLPYMPNINFSSLTILSSNGQRLCSYSVKGHTNEKMLL